MIQLADRRAPEQTDWDGASGRHDLITRLAASDADAHNSLKMLLPVPSKVPAGKKAVGTGPVGRPKITHARLTPARDGNLTLKRIPQELKGNDKF